MRMILRWWLACVAVTLIVLPGSAFGTYRISPDSLYKHISVLADDSLEGREVGEIGEWKAAQYISSLFAAAHLVPKGENGSFFQPFEFVKRINLTEKNKLSVNGIPLRLHEEYVPLSHSASMPFSFDTVIFVNYGIVAEENGTRYDDYAGKEVAGKAVLMYRYAPLDQDSTIDLNKYSSLANKIRTALDRRVSGIFLVTPEEYTDTLKTTFATKIQPKDVPVIFLKRAGLKRLGLDLSAPTIFSATGVTDLERVRDTGYNVIAYLPAENDTTLIIGAHYDHLGWGGPTSLYQGSPKMIHNGADDNASGTAGLLELARYFSSIRDSLKHSLLFIAFSGEEEGALGSNYFVHHMTVDSSKVKLMVNMDMIGHLRNEDHGLAVFGTGTCTAFKEYFDTLQWEGVKVTTKESGGGGSDQISFFNQKIPVLHFFTGTHEYYHRPSDDASTINLDGVWKVTTLIAEIIKDFDAYDKPIRFQLSKEAQQSRPHASYSVTLGIMPDFLSDVKGVRVDGVTQGRPAERAGILKGDIIIKMGTVKIDDIYDYMNGLSKFHPGDTADIIVIRDNDTLTVQAVF